MVKKLLFCATIAGSLALTSMAQASSAYDGSWDLVFVTQRGACDPNYNFSVNITNGVVTHPNLVRFRGYVARSGAVRASVTVQDNFASGSMRLAGNSGRGTWGAIQEIHVAQAIEPRGETDALYRAHGRSGTEAPSASFERRSIT